MFILEGNVGALFDKFGEVRKVSIVAAHSPTRLPSKWVKPPLGVIQLNFNAAIKDGLAVIAVVARWSLGEVCGIYIFQERIDAPAAAEAFIILQPVKITLKNWKEVVFESDAEVVI